MSETPNKKVALNGDNYMECFSHSLAENKVSSPEKAGSSDRMRITVKIGIEYP